MLPRESERLHTHASLSIVWLSPSLLTCLAKSGSECAGLRVRVGTTHFGMNLRWLQVETFPLPIKEETRPADKVSSAGFLKMHGTKITSFLHVEHHALGLNVVSAGGAGCPRPNDIQFR